MHKKWANCFPQKGRAADARLHGIVVEPCKTAKTARRANTLIGAPPR